MVAMEQLTKQVTFAWMQRLPRFFHQQTTARERSQNLPTVKHSGPMGSFLRLFFLSRFFFFLPGEAHGFAFVPTQSVNVFLLTAPPIGSPSAVQSNRICASCTVVEGL